MMYKAVKPCNSLVPDEISGMNQSTGSDPEMAYKGSDMSSKFPVNRIQACNP
jgi:hypothetical protein